MEVPDTAGASSSLDAVIDEARPVAEAFLAAGHRVYLVGGMVRDLRLGRIEADDLDLDLTTDATPDRIKAVIGPLADALWTQGERFGTIGARIGDRVYEITTHRSDVYNRASRKPEVQFSAAVEADLSRRDFTVNAMAVELPGGAVIDPCGGADDLVAGRLRTPLDPRVSFADDPLRMLRAARFLAGYDLVPTEDLVAAMTEMSGRLSIVSAERIRDELDKLLSLAAPSSGLVLLADTGVLAQVLPWLQRLPLSAIDALGQSARLRLSALTFDADTPGIRARLGGLRHSRARIDATVMIVSGAQALLAGGASTPPSFRRWYLGVGGRGGCGDDARRLARAVHSDGPAFADRSDRLEMELAAELDDLRPPLDAETVMTELGIGPGPDVGAALSHLGELRLDLGPIDPERARRLLHLWWTGRPT